VAILPRRILGQTGPIAAADENGYTPLLVEVIWMSYLPERLLIALGALLLLSIATVGAEPLTGIPNPRTRDGTWVTDTPGS